MPSTLWRLVKARHAATAFDSEGARRFGGRWNVRGVPVVYLSDSLSLAALEVFVHLSAEDGRLHFAAIRVDVPEHVAIPSLPAAELPPNWREEPPPDECKRIGSEWFTAGTSALLRLPSVIIPDEFNVLLNPQHSDFKALVFHPPQPFGFDARMWK